MSKSTASYLMAVGLSVVAGVCAIIGNPLSVITPGIVAIGLFMQSAAWIIKEGGTE